MVESKTLEDAKEVFKIMQSTLEIFSGFDK